MEGNFVHEVLSTAAGAYRHDCCYKKMTSSIRYCKPGVGMGKEQASTKGLSVRGLFIHTQFSGFSGF